MEFNLTVILGIVCGILLLTNIINFLIWFLQRQKNKEKFKRGTVVMTIGELTKIISFSRNVFQQKDSIHLPIKNKTGDLSDWQFDIYENIFKK